MDRIFQSPRDPVFGQITRFDGNFSDSDPVAVVILDLRARTVEPLGLFPSLSRCSEALGAEAAARDLRVLDPIAVNRDGQGSARVADVRGDVVLEYHLVANDGSEFGRGGGVALFDFSHDEAGAALAVVPCGVYASEEYLRESDEVFRQCIKGWDERRMRRLCIPFSGPYRME